MSIKKTILYSILILLLAGLAYIFNYAYNFGTVGTAYSAKILCSCVFVADRDEESGVQQELFNYNGFIDTEVDYENKSVTASISGMAEKTAVYREGLGCVLVNGMPAKELQSQGIELPEPIYPNQGSLAWPTGDLDTLPMPQGVDQTKLEAALDKIFTEDNPELIKNTRGVVVVYKGKIVAERYGKGFDENTRLLGWSMTKSVTNSLVGLLVKDGKLSLEDHALVPKWQDPSDPRNAITLDQLMRMSSGLDFEEEYFGYTDATKMLFGSKSASGYAVQSPLRTEPDGEWYYSSGTTNIISQIVRDQFDNDLDYWHFPYQRLFHKTGMNSAIMETDPSGTFVGSSFMYATTRDWARYGLLYLNDGVWNGERILPEGWANYSATPTPKSDRGGYGAQFWLNAGESGNPENRRFPNAPADMYFPSGFEGQNVVIIPSRDVVIVRLGLTYNRDAWNLGDFVADVLEGIPE